MTVLTLPLVILLPSPLATPNHEASNHSQPTLLVHIHQRSQQETLNQPSNAQNAQKPHTHTQPTEPPLGVA